MKRIFFLCCILATVGFVWHKTLAGEQVQWDLSEAAAKGDLDKVRELVEQRGAKANAWPKRGDYAHGISAINAAALEGRTEVVAYLLDHGADIETSESDIRSPLAVAIGRNDLPTARMLLERGANASASGSTLERLEVKEELQKLLKNFGAIEDTIFREAPPMHLLCVSRMVTDLAVGEFADEAAAAIRQAAEGAGLNVTGPLQLIFRGRNPRRVHLAKDVKSAPSYQLEVALPVLKFSDTAPNGFYFRTATAFKCVAGSTVGPRKTIESGWWIVENAIFTAGLGPTYETREVYREWHGFGSPKNVLEIQYGLFGATRGNSGELEYGHDDRPYLREAYR